MRLRRRIAELQVAAMLLTRLPAGRLPDPVPSLAAARWAYPLIGLPVGFLCWLAFAAGLSAGVPAPVAAMLFLVVNALVTGGLHHDGLADFADGIGGGRDRQQCLDIMRDSRIGSYGVLALGLALGCQGAALSAIGHDPGVAVILAIAVASRLAMLVVMCVIPAARADGLGRTAEGRGGGALVVGAAASLVLLLTAGPPAGAIVVCAGSGAAIVAGLAWRRLRGQTGDVLGAALMVFETIALVVLSALIA